MTDSTTMQEQTEQAPKGTPRAKLKFYLDTGAVLEFEAVKYGVTQGTLNGDIRGYSFEDAIGEVPFAVDPAHLIAVTREIPDDGSES